MTIIQKLVNYGQKKFYNIVPRLYADNVRSVMADHLKVPLSEKRVEDVFQPEKV